MDNLDQFRSLVDAKQSELIFRDLVARQQAGEFRSDDDLRKALTDSIAAVKTRGRITFELPIQPWDTITAERFTKFFEDIKMDMEVLFTEVDHTDEVLAGLASVMATHLRTLQFSLGNLRTELTQRSFRIPPGSGWNLVSRDSFDQGYGHLLGRAETITPTLFEDSRAGFIQDHERVPIKPDARIEGVAKKLVLAETGNETVGFKRAQLLWDSETTPGDIALENPSTTWNMIDGRSDTFWSYLIGSVKPLLGSGVGSLVQIAGSAYTDPIVVDTSGLLDQKAFETYMRITGFSGIYPTVVSLESPADYKGPTCNYDLGTACRWNLVQAYTPNCVNLNCSRYTHQPQVISGGRVDLQDGHNYDTGANLVFSGISGIHAGQTWRVSIIPSGRVGATIKIQLDLTRPTFINWLSFDPVIGAPFVIEKVQYSQQGASGMFDILDSEIQGVDRIRLDFKAIEAERIYLTLRQETFDHADIHLRPETIAIQKLEQFQSRENAPSIVEFFSLPLENLLNTYISNNVANVQLKNLSDSPVTKNGFFYQFGLFEVDCGLTTFADTSIAVAKEVRGITPRMIAVQANLEPDFDFASGLQPGGNGTVEFTILKYNYEQNNSLINVDTVPLPVMSADGYVTERLFLDETLTADLRLSAALVSGIRSISEGVDLDSDQWEITNTKGSVHKSSLQINHPGVTQSSILLVTYKPEFGVFLNDAKTISLEDNRTRQLSISSVPAILVCDAKSANRFVAYADTFLKVVMRRNDLDIYSTPGLRDYQLLISEGDLGRFF